MRVGLVLALAGLVSATRLLPAAGPLELKCCCASLEVHPELAEPRLILRALPAKIEEAELQQMTVLLSDTLDRNLPFSVLWDLRQMRPPSRAALRYGIDWMGENAEPIDELVQSTVIVASSPVVRAICSMILKVCRPPRPVRLCENDVAALEEARALLQKEAKRTREPMMTTQPDDDDDDIVLDDISGLLEAMDIDAPASGSDEAATAWEASQLPSELPLLDVDGLKQSLLAMKEEEERAENAEWKSAFGAGAEVGDIVIDEADSGSDDDVGEIVTF